MPDIRPQILELKDWLVEMRRDIHMHPEMAYQEVRTAGLVERTLKDLGLKVRSGVGRTGILGWWPAEEDGPCLGLRADMDALPVEESPGREWRSKVPGVMHACGHDLHTAMLMGAARIMVEDRGLKKGLAGSVKFIFQPAEENGAGAAAMIADGALEDPPLDAVFAAHVLPNLKVGQVGFAAGASHAAVDNFYLEVKGRGGHAAHPELAADPLAPTAELVRRIKAGTSDLDRALVAVCTFNAGTVTNIIPDRAYLSGTIRSLAPEARSLARDLVETAAREIERESGLKITVRIEAGYPMLYNDEAVTRLFRQVAAEVVGPDNVLEQGPTFGAEDMAYFQQKIPGLTYGLGCSPDREPIAMLHSPDFDPNEEVLPLGVELMVRLAETFLARKV